MSPNMDLYVCVFEICYIGMNIFFDQKIMIKELVVSEVFSLFK